MFYSFIAGFNHFHSMFASHVAIPGISFVSKFPFTRPLRIFIIFPIFLIELRFPVHEDLSIALRLIGHIAQDEDH